MKNTLTVLLALLMVNITVVPSILSLVTDVEIVCIDFSEEEKKENTLEKEFNDLILQNFGNAIYFEDNNLYALRLDCIHAKYTYYFEVHIPPPEQFS